MEPLDARSHSLCLQAAVVSATKRAYWLPCGYCLLLGRGLDCREAYKALDIRNRRVVQGLQLAMAQHRQLLQDVSISDPGHSGAHTVMSDGLGGHGQCLDLSTHDAWASTSPLV